MARSAKPSFAGSNPARASFMKIAIIGAGFTGLAAAWDLTRAGHQVTVYEIDKEPGGLAAGFKQTHWQWSLEHHYHHIFSLDREIISWVKELGLADQLFFKRVKTSTRYRNQQFQLDSPLSLLRCPVLSPCSRLRTAATLAFLKIWPFWQCLEKVTAERFLSLTMGDQTWQILWQPLFVNKFGRHAKQISAAWFWARITARSASLGYFRGGFGQLAKATVEKLQLKNVEFKFQTPIEKIIKKNHQWQVLSAKETNDFNAVLFTANASLLSKLATDLPSTFTQKTNQLKSLAARTLVLELNQPFFKDQTYWLNINQIGWPFLAVVEHTNLTGRQSYGNHTLLYVGKYLESGSQLYEIPKEQLLAEYQPYLNQLSPGFAQTITNTWDFKAEFAQPVVGLNHSRHLPKFVTPLPGLYWASMQHVYPQDRGTNYAVKLGRQVARVIGTIST